MKINVNLPKILHFKDKFALGDFIFYLNQIDANRSIKWKLCGDDSHECAIIFYLEEQFKEADEMIKEFKKELLANYNNDMQNAFGDENCFLDEITAERTAKNPEFPQLLSKYKK